MIAPLPPSDGREWHCQCARCGSSTDYTRCESCGGDGFTEPGELYEQDPLWYDEDETEACGYCQGRGGWRACVSSEEWCKANPLPERAHVERGAIEWFTFDAAPHPRHARAPGEGA